MYKQWKDKICKEDWIKKQRNSWKAICMLICTHIWFHIYGWLFKFHSTSTTIGYSMPNPVYIYELYMICNHFLYKLTFLLNSCFDPFDPQVGSYLCFIFIWIQIIIIMSCRQEGYPQPSLATSPYRSSPLAGLQGYISYPHRAAVCMFEQAVLLLLLRGGP